MPHKSSSSDCPSNRISGRQLAPDWRGRFRYVPYDGPRARKEEPHTFAYWAPEEGGWILLSTGPDGRFDLDFDTLKEAYDPRFTTPTALLLHYTHDPTNGTRSSGDLWHMRTTR